jgi:hypothetical protein
MKLAGLLEHFSSNISNIPISAHGQRPHHWIGKVCNVQYVLGTYWSSMYSVTVHTSMYWYVTQKVRTFSLKYVLYHAFCTQYVQSTYLFENYVLGTYLG